MQGLTDYQQLQDDFLLELVAAAFWVRQMLGLRPGGGNHRRKAPKMGGGLGRG